MCNSDRQIALLEEALRYPIKRRELLQQRETLQEILKDIPARQWLFDRVSQVGDRNRAIKARLFIVELVQYSGQIWRGGGSVSSDAYDEALARTWQWFSENLHTYDPEAASPITWFNNKLRWMIQDVIREIATEESRRYYPPDSSEEGDEPPFDYPASEPDRWKETLEKWLELVQADPEKQLSRRRMQKYPHVNCQTLLLCILEELRNSEQIDWRVIAKAWEVDLRAVRRFYKEQCSPCFRGLVDKYLLSER